MNAVVIVAGGKGLRMGSEVPKQFLSICGRPILMRTMERFRQVDPSMRIVLVLPREQQDYWADLCVQHRFGMDYTLAVGGQTRFQSVWNGLQKVGDGVELVGIHDGVRPFVTVDVIRRCYEAAALSGAAAPATDVVDTIRRLLPEGDSMTVPREMYKLVQTPQVFYFPLILKCYEGGELASFTDDASVVEYHGHDVTLVDGNRENIKITTPFDLDIATVICQKQNS